MKGAAQELPNDALDELAQVPFDDALDAMGHVKRRELLFALLAHDTEGESPDILIDAAGTAARDDERAEMIHRHLPKLAEYGFISWDREAREVGRGTEFDEIRPLLELLADHEDELPEDWL